MSVLLVASVGGHLSELAALARRTGLADGRRVWMTWRNPQSESLLAGEEVVWVRPVQPRDLGAVLAVGREVPAVLRRYDVRRVVTTGSALALSVVPAARARGVSCHFIETATRPGGASLTGRLLRLVPGTHLYTQHLSTAHGPWRYGGSIFDGFRVEPLDAAGCDEPRPIRRAVVTLGTMDDFGFRRLLARALRVLPAGADVLWQTGCTDTTGLPIDARPLMPAAELEAAMAESDVVIGHCGCGTALSAFAAGKVPVLVPRQAVHREHVDDHQQQLADELTRLGLAVTTSADRLDVDHLMAAASSRVVHATTAPPFRLVEDPTAAPHAGRRARRQGQAGTAASALADSGARGLVATPGLPPAPVAGQLQRHAEARRQAVGSQDVLDPA